ncbi:hypothetical protein GIB67_022070 [Kingdonia uniflora]|uniref:Uncharacterized protein n=1 Tax=Kingdonia uniflora TaxID=39325 RepID=A0A7J7MUB5_9MAGN|nr:hypothetical protein GIB67_022070 [Kingdonia uniflora]
MADQHQPSHSTDPKVPRNTGISSSNGGFKGTNSFKGYHKNPPETTIPDPVTLKDQWRYATRQYSRWYSQAWGTAILAGMTFFALGWFIKGENPLPSRKEEHQHNHQPSPSTSIADGI